MSSDIERSKLRCSKVVLVDVVFELPIQHVLPPVGAVLSHFIHFLFQSLQESVCTLFVDVGHKQNVEALACELQGRFCCFLGNSLLIERVRDNHRVGLERHFNKVFSLGLYFCQQLLLVVSAIKSPFVLE